MKFVDLLPIVKLPFETNCEACCKRPVLDSENDLIKKYKPEGSDIVGLVEKTTNRVVLLVTYPADIVLPSIKVYNLEGRLTGQMNFMTSYCGQDFEYSSWSDFRINNDLSFSTTKKSYHLKMDTIDFQVTDTIRVEIKNKVFKINKQGEIVEIDTQ